MFLTYAPNSPLSQFVVKFWYTELAPPHAFEQVLPNGDMALVINLRDAELRVYDRLTIDSPHRFVGPTVMGAHSHDFVIDTRLQASLIGVQFRPGGALPFLRDSADRFRNRHVALEDLWGHAAIDLQAQLMEARTARMRFCRLEEALLARLADSFRPHPGVVSALSTFAAGRGTSSIEATAITSGLSWRRFIEQFRREVGIPPKTFCRIRRFQHALQLLGGRMLPELRGIGSARWLLRSGAPDSRFQGLHRHHAYGVRG